MVKILKFIGSILLVASYIVLLVSAHNIDISYNMLYLDIPYDTNPIGNIRTSPEIYLNGFLGIHISLLLSFIGFCFLLISNKEIKKKWHHS